MNGLLLYLGFLSPFYSRRLRCGVAKRRGQPRTEVSYEEKGKKMGPTFSQLVGTLVGTAMSFRPIDALLVPPIYIETVTLQPQPRHQKRGETKGRPGKRLLWEANNWWPKRRYSMGAARRKPSGSGTISNPNVQPPSPLPGHQPSLMTQLH